jgi:hypothetical protein
VRNGLLIFDDLAPRQQTQHLLRHGLRRGGGPRGRRMHHSPYTPGHKPNSWESHVILRKGVWIRLRCTRCIADPGSIIYHTHIETKATLKQVLRGLFPPYMHGASGNMSIASSQNFILRYSRFFADQQTRRMVFILVPVSRGRGLESGLVSVGASALGCLCRSGLYALLLPLQVHSCESLPIPAVGTVSKAPFASIPILSVRRPPHVTSWC